MEWIELQINKINIAFIDLAHSSAIINSRCDCAALPAYKDMKRREVIYP